MDIIGLTAFSRCGPFGYLDLALARDAGTVIAVNWVCAVVNIARGSNLGGGQAMLMGDALLLDLIDACLYFNVVARPMIIVAAVGYYKPGT